MSVSFSLSKHLYNKIFCILRLTNFQGTIVMVVFVFMVVVVVLSILLLVIMHVHRHNDRHARHACFSRFPRSKESLEDEWNVSVSPSRPTFVGRTSTTGCPVIHVTVTPPTPVRLPSDPPETTVKSREG